MREIGSDLSEVIGEVDVLRLDNELSYENAHEVIEQIKDSLENKPKKLVLDLSDTESLDSSGLRALVQGRKLCEDAGVDFRIGQISECAERVIKIGGFSEFLGLDETMPEIAELRRKSSIDLGKCKTYEYVVASESSMISVLRNKACDAAVEAGAYGDDLCDIQIAVGEALTNAYRHGSPNKDINKIAMRCIICSNAYVVEIEDEGEPFDPHSTSEPDPKMLRDHGMGIYLMRQAMDEVEFTIGSPGNKVRMVKWLKSRK